MGTLYPKCVKTPKGLEEVERKVHGLPLKSRQVLIMIDGKRDLAALQDIFPPAIVPGILEDLLNGGFIRELEPPPPPKESSPPPQPKPAARVPMASNDEERFTLARNFMMNTVSAFVGLAGSSLIAKIEQAMDFEGLMPLYYEWYDAVGLTKDGKKRLPELEAQLLKLLGDVPPRPVLEAKSAEARELAAQMAAKSASQSASQSAPQPAPQARRPADDDERLTMARNFIINTTNTFVGIVGSALVEKAERAGSISDLRHLYFDWKETMQLDKEGRQRLPELEKRLAALLS